MTDQARKATSDESRGGPGSREVRDALESFPGLSNIAVALRHDRGNGQLPRIVASGRGAVAEQILAVAYAEGVQVRQDADLAEVLVALEVGSEIPVEAFAAVAEILAYIYRANQFQGASRMADGGARPETADGDKP